MSTDSIGDLLTRIRNAQRAGHHTAVVRGSKLGKSILEVLRAEGFIGTIGEVDGQGGTKDFEVSLKYTSGGKPVMQTARRVSKPGRRVYSRVDELPRVECGLGVVLVSTSQGVMSDREARSKKLGGEVLAFIS
jgi:small subunit ribosomal protein S8